LGLQYSYTVSGLTITGVIYVSANKRVLFELRATNNAAAAYAGRASAQRGEMNDMTMLHGRIIKFLYDNQDKDIFQKDIETLLSVRRSTVTTIIKCMEKNGLITRMSVTSDARLKKLLLTEKARSIHKSIGEEIEKTERLARKNISDDELEIFFSVLDRIKNNLRTE